ncbi:MAG: SDR family NAD(P)-dependent oxidoreductase [Byssovorax sp.]
MSLRRADDRLRTALVTGACSGIGRAIAELLGSLGYTLILASNREGPLGEAAAQIRAAHGVAAHPVVVDLARPGGASTLVDAVDVLGIEVDILVNNAGIFFFGEVADADPARAEALLHLHVLTPSLLCTHLGRRMRDRGRGEVLIVASIAAFRDFPGIAYYGSSKKYLRGFARALRCELRPYGVNVTCLCPGATATGLYDPSVIPVELGKRLGVMMDPEAVARAGVEAMFDGQSEVVPGALTRVMTAAAVAIPQPAIDWLRRHGPWMRRRRR